MKHSLLYRTLIIILLTIIMSAALTTVLFSIYGKSVFADQKAEELVPRAEYCAEQAWLYLMGLMSRATFESLMSPATMNDLWDAQLYMYNAEGELFAYLDTESSTELRAYVEPHLESVLNGEHVTTPAELREYCIIVGTPITSYGNTPFVGDRIQGAVFLVKPISEISAAVNALITALVVSMLAVAALMIIPAYFASKSITGPVNRMTDVAQAIALGDFKVNAPERGRGELARLGSALNHMSDELERTIKDLTLERNRLRAIMNGLGEGVMAINAEGKLTHCNDAAIRLMGGGRGCIPAGSDIYRSIMKFMTDVSLNMAAKNEQLKVGERLLHITITPLPNREDHVAGAVVLMRDVTESERLEQTRRDYVANVSHELRTPISAIRSLADALSDGLIKNDFDRSRYYGYILKESMRLSRLIDDLLELSRLQSGGVAFEKYSFDITELIRNAADCFTEIASDCGFRLSLSLDNVPVTVYSNPDRIEQVIVILLDNAVKHSEGGREILLGADLVEDRIIIFVENPGYIDETDIEHLFERFYKADKAHSGNGTGLGLAIAKETISLLGGNIQAFCKNGRVRFEIEVRRDQMVLS